VNSGVRELRIVYSPVETVGPLPQVGRPTDAAALLRERIEQESVEVCIVLLLNTKAELIAVHEMGRGTLNACHVSPRDVFTAALLANAASVIFGHDHPSGDPTPSADDIALLGRLRAASDILGVTLADFIIIGDGTYYSFQEMGR